MQLCKLTFIFHYNQRFVFEGALQLVWQAIFVVAPGAAAAKAKVAKAEVAKAEVAKVEPNYFGIFMKDAAL